ncbi:MAG: divergent polysaccharide deacetylase family protein [Deltaproteobacteria bacterium]|nr:divergent polysaccharide deacetylase family protein [Deltaproteobacteria bacterium]
MASGKRPRRKKKKRTPSGKDLLLKWSLAAVAVVILLLLFLWFDASFYQQPPAIPAYEEVQVNGFTSLLGEVEIAIYHGLRELGVKESQIRFRKVVQRSRGNRHWEYVEIEVRLKPSQNLVQTQNIVTKNLQTVSGAISWEANGRTPSSRDLTVRVMGMLTHKIILTHKIEQPPARARKKPAARVAIVIDDLGYDRRLAEKFLAIKEPLSFSVLPHGRFSKTIASEIHKKGKELMLHLPMEPKGFPEVNPGPGALLLAMTDEELRQQLQEDLASFSSVVGVNNHMGSRFCEQAAKMKIVLQEIKKRNLFFLDSRTSKDTTGYTLAKQLGIPSAERNVFLDNIQSPRAIRSQLRRLVQLARLKGRAIGIAHPHQVTLEVLSSDLPKLKEQGVELVLVSQIIHPPT